MSEPHVMADQFERTLAATDLATTYIVEAAAGTGKTTLLVDRILTIIRERQVPLARIVAITFTEKAAGELKIKLRKKLEAAAQADSHHRSHYQRALLELDTMPVSTIHAFCRDLIQERPVEAGVEPIFTVASQPTAELLHTEVWQEWIAQEFSHDCPAARPFLERGTSVVSAQGFSLRNIYDLLLDYREDLERLHVECLSDEILLQRVVSWRTELDNELRVLAECRNPTDGAAQALQKIIEWLSVAPMDNLGAAVEWLERAPDLSSRARGSKENWNSKTVLETAQSLRKEFPRRVNAVYSLFVSRWAEDLVEWAKGAVRAYFQAESARGLLDFQDLLLLARNMLRESHAARDYFKQRFDYLLVDEFQDTDPLQAEIVFYLAERGDSFAEQWEDVQLVPGKLFIVGDPKQSIYRFRRADLDLYGQVRAKIEACGKCLHIRVNFRSMPDILHEVNDIFSSQMTGARNGRYEPEYVALEPYRAEVKDLPQVVCLPPQAGWWSSKPLAGKQAETEAACTAAYIREQVASGGVAYRDIGILYSATTRLSELENALRAAEIPYQVAGGKKFIERSEVLALRTVISALDNPFDEVSVVGALRSPFFACSDEDILTQSLDGGSFNYLRVQGVLPHVEECLAVLRNLHHDISLRTPSEIIGMLLARTKGLQIYALKPQGESRVANLLKLLDMARALESEGNPSFHALSRKLAQLEESRAGEEDSATAESGDDVVRLLTVHKAKGLEFPVVILFRLGTGHDPRAKPVISRHSKSVEFSAGNDLTTSGHRAACDEEDDREECEDLRLLYVAMTRARERLVIPAYWNDPAKGFYRFLRARLGANHECNPAVDGSRFALHDTSHYVLASPATGALKLDAEFAPSDQRVLSAQARKAEWETQRANAVTRLQRNGMFAMPSQPSREAVKGRSSEDIETFKNGKAFGSYVHGLLELVILPGGANLERLARSTADQFNMDSEQIRQATNLIQHALASDLFKRAAEASAVYRELPFTDLHDGVLCEGVIDLAFVAGEQLVIVDYKTDLIPTEAIEEHVVLYSPQLRAYRRALEKITGLPVSETLLYFLQPNRVVAVD